MFLDYKLVYLLFTYHKPFFCYLGRQVTQLSDTFTGLEWYTILFALLYQVFYLSLSFFAALDHIDVGEFELVFVGIKVYKVNNIPLAKVVTNLVFVVL